MRWKLAAAAASAVALAAIGFAVFAFMLGRAPARAARPGVGPLTLNGSVVYQGLPYVDWMPASGYGNCGPLTAGRPGAVQLTVVSASGTVLGAAELAHGDDLSGPCVIPFSVTVPGGGREYGVRVEGVPGTRWLTESQVGVQLTLNAGGA
jgi:hypothetical protein